MSGSYIRHAALRRVQQHREWKIALIEADDPDWCDVWDEWFPETNLQ